MPKRPSDPNERAFQIVRESTGQIPRREREASPLAARASKGGQARAAALTDARRREIAKRGAAARWSAAREDKPDYGD